MSIVFNDLAHGHAIGATVKHRFLPPWDTCVSRVKDGELLGGVIFVDATDNSIAMHMAGLGPGWVNKDLIWIVFDYVFVQLDLNYVYVKVRADNKRALAIDLKLGFKEVVRLPGVFRDADLVVLAMRRDECRWLDVDCEASRLMRAVRHPLGR